MKGYVTGNKLYIFDEAGQIPYVDAAVEIIYVQQEYLEAFKEANSDYASLMKPYNFQMLTVKAKEWSGHTDDEIEAPEPEVTLYNVTLVDQNEIGLDPQNIDENGYEAGTEVAINFASDYESYDPGNVGNPEIFEITSSVEGLEFVFDYGTGGNTDEQIESTPASLSFTMPASNVTFTFAVINNPDYQPEEEPA